MKPRRRALTLLSILAMTLSVASAAHAAAPQAPAGPKRIIRSYVITHPLPYTRQQIVAELRAKGSLDRFGIRADETSTQDRPLTARQTEQLAIADQATYTTQPQPAATGAVAPQAKTYDYITPEECDAHADQAQKPPGWIKNHFAYCQIHDIFQVAIEFVPDPVPVGVFGATVRLIGYGKTGVAPGTTASRWVSFGFNVNVTAVDGVFGNRDALLRVTLPCHGSYDNSADGSGANACHPGAVGSVEKPIPDWFLDGDAQLDLLSDAATPDEAAGQQVARATYRPEYHFTIPGFHQFYTPRGRTGGVRFDSAWYLGPIDPTNRLGSIFDRTVPSIAYSTTKPEDPTQDVSDVAHHIQDALAHPETSYPPKDGKVIPGGAADSLVHRLYPGLSFTNQARYDENRNFSISYCDNNPQWAGYRDLGFSCDEYPYASTYEGAAAYIYQNDPSLKFNVSVRPVPAPVNENAGRALSAFYGSDRILNNDGFFNRIVA